MNPTKLRKKNHQQIDQLPEQALKEVYSITSQYGEKCQPFTALVDSGADGSILPARILNFSDLDEARRVRMVGVGGVSQIMTRYWVGIEIGEISIWGI